MENLRRVRRAKGESMKLLGEIVGVSESAISHYETGKRQPDFETLLRLAEHYSVSVDYLLGNVTDPFFVLDNRRILDDINSPNHALSPIIYKKQIPILGRISAGMPMIAVENIEGYENVEDESLDYGLIVRGDSMIGARIFEGDVVYVAKDTDIVNGDIVIALINGDDATIKRFYQYDNEIILKPENPTMKEQHYNPEAVQLLGKVMQVKFNIS